MVRTIVGEGGPDKLSQRSSSLKRSECHVLTRITQFCPTPTRLSTNGMSHPAFTPQPQSITALWPVLISHPTEGRRLNWPVWLATYLDDMPALRRSPIPCSINRPGIELTTIELQVRRPNH